MIPMQRTPPPYLISLLTLNNDGTTVDARQDGTTTKKMMYAPSGWNATTGRGDTVHVTQISFMISSVIAVAASGFDGGSALTNGLQLKRGAAVTGATTDLHGLSPITTNDELMQLAGGRGQWTFETGTKNALVATIDYAAQGAPIELRRIGAGALDADSIILQIDDDLRQATRPNLNAFKIMIFGYYLEKQ